MAEDDNVHSWNKVQEIRSGGRFTFVGDASVRRVGPSLKEIVLHVAASVRYRSISDVIVGPADATGWRDIRPSWLWQMRRPPPSGQAAGAGAIAILIGLVRPPTELEPLKLLGPYLLPNASLHLPAGHKFTLESHFDASFDGFGAGFTGGVFVATH